MSWYKEDKDIWKELIETVAAETARSNTMVEKDAIQSMFLNNLAESGLSFVFKGGTSLSKVYGLIDRFSEDIDLSMTHKPTESQKKNSKKAIIDAGKSLELVLVNEDQVFSRHDYNIYEFKFESLFSDEPGEILVETNFFIDAYPAEVRKVNSFIEAFCKNSKISVNLPVALSQAEMFVQSVERTFIDKVFAVCDYKLQNMQNRDSRHLYDVAKLIDHVEFNEDFKRLVKDVRKDRSKLKNNLSAQPQYNIPDLLKEIIDSHFYASDYNDITTKLLYEDYPYEKAIENGITKVIDSGMF